MISKINSFSPSFGVVKKSAVNRAVKEAKGDIEKIKGVVDLCESQRNNDKYDVIWNPELGGYSIVGRKPDFIFDGTTHRYNTLAEACSDASYFKDI